VREWQTRQSTKQKYRLIFIVLFFIENHFPVVFLFRPSAYFERYFIFRNSFSPRNADKQRRLSAAYFKCLAGCQPLDKAKTHKPFKSPNRLPASKIRRFDSSFPSQREHPPHSFQSSGGNIPAFFHYDENALQTERKNRTRRNLPLMTFQIKPS